MNNEEFWDSIKKYNEHKNPDDGDLFCDQMVKEGLGQTVGGYFDIAKKTKYNKIIDNSIAEPSQAFHFQEYYIDNENNKGKNPTYSSLKCPQLIMYIAEMAGLKREILVYSLKLIRTIEEEKNLVGKDKGGGYLEKLKLDDGTNELSEFKNKIHIAEINDIIKQASSYKEITDAVSKIEASGSKQGGSHSLTEVK